MGIHCVIFHGHCSNSMDKGIEVGIHQSSSRTSLAEKFVMGWVKLSWNICGMNLVSIHFLQVQQRETDSSDDEDDKVSGHKGERAKMEKDSLGALVLPPYSSLKLPGQKDAIQKIMHESYSKPSIEPLPITPRTKRAS
ncbi:hypothetical protein PAXRUDRAFT_180342 [Paxillus rubicundulus Ve08.2h10]|uniref:Uncharacterized protein n=1 Tax=Paxillus rubicundulus Ve08.2h10 TaxID=930991 RepID=A0A0D0BLQ9_9AGAM|nr:hypothetical protein PAXRUDRAFT_180342 [Paxillus rubicundulus Ve08.2h10]